MASIPQSPDPISSSSVSAYPDLTIDPAALLKTVWDERVLICAGALAVTALAGIGAYGFSKFKSDASFQLQTPAGNISYFEYKRIAPAVAERSRVERYMTARKLTDDPSLTNLPKILANIDASAKYFAPQWVLSKADVKEMADIGKSDGANQLQGIKINVEDASAEPAKRKAMFIAEYLRDVTYHVLLTDMIRSKYSDLRLALIAMDNRVIGANYQLKTLNERAKDLKAIGQRYPDAMRLGAGGSLLSLTDSMARYLPLNTQLVAIETSIAEVTQSLGVIQRERDQTQFSYDYFSALEKAITPTVTGEDLVKAMPIALAEASKGKDLQNERYKQVAIGLEIDGAKYNDAFYVRSRFISGPTSPEAKTTRLALVLPLALISGLMLMCIVALLKKWFQAHRSEIFSEKSQPVTTTVVT